MVDFRSVNLVFWFDDGSQGFATTNASDAYAYAESMADQISAIRARRGGLPKEEADWRTPRSWWVAALGAEDFRAPTMRAELAAIELTAEALMIVAARALAGRATTQTIAIGADGFAREAHAAHDDAEEVSP
jgi:hypothetical protein